MIDIVGRNWRFELCIGKSIVVDMVVVVGYCMDRSTGCSSGYRNLADCCIPFVGCYIPAGYCSSCFGCCILDHTLVVVVGCYSFDKLHIAVDCMDLEYSRCSS